MPHWKLKTNRGPVCGPDFAFGAAASYPSLSQAWSNIDELALGIATMCKLGKLPLWHSARVPVAGSCVSF
jgi:hypothetical protein